MSQKQPSSAKRSPTAQAGTKPAAVGGKPVAPEKSLLTTYLRAFILFVAAAAVILFVLSRLGDSTSFPADDSVEAGFSRDMITHHSQAVQMSLIVRDRLSDDAPIELDQFLWDIISTQQNQIGQMEAWLNVWGLPQGTSASPMAWMGHEVDGLMPGMATTEQIAELSTLPEDEMVVRFMELMTVHHLAAVDMGNAILDLSDEPVVVRLADAMVRTQDAEIAIMNGWIETYSGSAPPVEPVASPGASPVASPTHDHD